MIVRRPQAIDLAKRIPNLAMDGLSVLAADGRVLGTIEMPTSNLEEALAELAFWLGDPPADGPPARKEYLGRTIASTFHWTKADSLLGDRRERDERLSELLEALALEPGMTVADVGCGVGTLSLPIAEQVGPEGEVYALEIQKPMLDRLRVRAEEAEVGNVRCWVSTPADTFLPPASCDLVLFVDVYHEVDRPAAVLASVREGLAPGGRVAIVESRSEDPVNAKYGTHAMSKAQIVEELEANGFLLASSYDELPRQHLLFFTATTVL